jgi:4-hydroxy-3-methylbut-2-enyl diphosphate reductase
MEIIEAKYAGMCGGVKYTVTSANEILDKNPGKKVYCLGELVHNKTVVGNLEKKGLVVIEDINQVPDNIVICINKNNTKILEQIEQKNVIILIARLIGNQNKKKLL